MILALAEVQNRRANAEHQRGEKERQPESDVSLGIHHGKLAHQRTDVDHQVEVQIDTGYCRSRIDDHSLSIFQNLDEWLLLSVLLCNQWRNIGPVVAH